MKKRRRFGLFFMFLLLPITLNYFSPYLIIDGLANKILSGAFFVWTVMLVSSLFVGRSFCAYICPYGGMQMTVDAIIKKPLKEIHTMRVVKMVLGILWLVPILILFFLNLKGSKVNFLYLTEAFISADNAFKLIQYYVIVIALMVLPLWLGKRASCHYLCPMSILNIAGTRIKDKLNLPSLSLKAESSNCTNCHQCNKVCPMSLKVSDMAQKGNMSNNECILCGECSNACKFGAVTRIYGKSTNNSSMKIKNTVTKNI